MAEHIRVHDKSLGYNVTIPARRFDPKLYTRVSDEPALDRHGDPAEPNYHPARARKQARKAAQAARAPKSTRPDEASGAANTGQQKADTSEEDN